MKELDFKNLQSVTTETRWKKLAEADTWESILQLCSERLCLLHEDLKKRLDCKELENPEDLVTLDDLVGNSIIGLTNLLALIQKLDFEVTRGFYENEAIESKNYIHIKLLQEESKILKERIKKLEDK